MTGERLPETGHPMIPARWNSAKAAGLQTVELVVGGGERVVPVGPTEHVIEVVVRGRLEGRQERCAPGTGDGGGRQPRVESSVVRAVDVQIRVGEPVRRVRVDVSDRRVDAEGHPDLQTV